MNAVFYACCLGAFCYVIIIEFLFSFFSNMYWICAFCSKWQTKTVLEILLLQIPSVIT